MYIKKKQDRWSGRKDPRLTTQKTTHCPRDLLRTTTTMMKQAAFFLALAASSASAIELTPDNFAAETDGKTVFLKFFAPWVSTFLHFVVSIGEGRSKFTFLFLQARLSSDLTYRVMNPSKFDHLRTALTRAGPCFLKLF